MTNTVTAGEAEISSGSLSTAAGTVRHVPIASLHTSYARLRPGVLPPRCEPGVDLPLRVAMASDGNYEVLDGFKRLKRWREQGHALVPVVIEPAGATTEHKRLLLCANSPARTLTAMDEARVVCSLVHEDDLSPRTVAHLLGRKRDWVERRLALGTQLGPEAADQLARGAIGPSLASALVAFAPKEQNDLLAAIDQHEVPAHKTLRLVAAFRVADQIDRRRLLTDPLGQLAAEQDHRPTASPQAAVLERTLNGFRQCSRSTRASFTPITSRSRILCART